MLSLNSYIYVLVEDIKHLVTLREAQNKMALTLMRPKAEAEVQPLNALPINGCYTGSQKTSMTP